MIKVYDAATGTSLGAISENALRFLVGQLEEEGLEDQDYYINQDELDSLQSSGAPAELVDLLRRALAGREDMDIRWERQ